jgi:archaemetzincin
LQQIVLLPLNLNNEEILNDVRNEVAAEFKARVILSYIPFDVSAYIDAKRLQYDANTIMRDLYPLLPASADKVVAIMDGDLFIPILTFIFGQAYVNNKLSLVSTYRLLPERYGLPPDEKIFKARLVKEVIHELGHNYGLRHCFQPVCVMRSSTYVEDIDLKEQHLCPKCRLKIPHLTPSAL